MTGTLKQKVLSYITKGDHLLIFRHTQYPEVGYQVPGGSILPHEQPAEAALREAIEETGLKQLRFRSYLGKQTYDMRPFKNELQERHVYHFSCDEPTQELWQHYETHPETGGRPIEFEFSWVPLDGSDIGLAVGQGEMLIHINRQYLNTQRTRFIHRCQLANDLQKTIHAYRIQRVTSISKSFQALLGDDVPDINCTYSQPSAYAALQHLFYRIKIASVNKDSSSIFDAINNWKAMPEVILHNLKRPIVIQREFCEIINDPNFESPLCLLRPELLLNKSNMDLLNYCVQVLELIQSLGFGYLIDNILGIIITLSNKGSVEATESYTLSAFPGTVFIDRVNEPVRFGELILHESAHNWLNDALSSLKEELPREKRYWSPWKKTERSVYGLLHAAFAFSQMIQYFRYMAEDETITAYEKSYCCQRLSVEIDTLEEGLNDVVDVINLIKNPVLRGFILDECNRALQPQ